MIYDLDEFEDGTPFAADIVVVGGGVAGITLAMKLAEGARSVILLEAGGETYEEESQELYDGEVADEALHPAPKTYRQRRLGGTSTIWGGRCVPFDTMDFAQRPWIAHSGWPFDLSDLQPFYAESNALCEAGRFAYTAEQAFPEGVKPILSSFAGQQFDDNTLERFSCPSDFGRRYRRRLASDRNIRTLLHANVTNINSSVSGRVDSVTVQTLKGKQFEVSAGRFVLAMGGLEIPRLLLSSQAAQPGTLGDGTDWIGRGYMCHIAGTIGSLQVATGVSVEHGYHVAQEGTYCRQRFTLKPQAQRDLAVGNFVARLHHPRIPDPSHRSGFLSAIFLAKPFISYEYRKRLHGGDKASMLNMLAHVRNIASDPVKTGGVLAHWAITHTLAERKFPSIIVKPPSGKYSVDFNAEQEPNPDSRITLTQDKDRLGMRKMRVDWRYTANDMRTVRVSLRALAADLEASRSATLQFDDDEVEVCALRDGAYGGHHIGTTRMSASPRSGVVDSDCRVHGTPNLYIASSSVFPTSSHANPTLTVVAMTLRLAEHLERIS